MKRNLVLLAVFALIVAVPASAQEKDLQYVGTRLGPSNFTLVDGDFCSSPNAFIGLGAPVVQDTLDVAGGATISGLTVGLQVAHTWVGDLSATVQSPGSTSALIMDQPGFPESTFGCSGDDIDANLFDAAGGGSVDSTCAASVPTIGGDLTPAPDALSVFDGEDPNGTWTLTLTDAFEGSDDGTLQTWCISPVTGGGDGGDGGGVPATSTWGVIAMIALFMGVSVYFLRRRVHA
jgi:hypothetical protein